MGNPSAATRRPQFAPCPGDVLVDDYGYRWGVVYLVDRGYHEWVCVEHIGGERDGERWWLRRVDFVAGFADARAVKVVTLQDLAGV